MSQSIAVFLKCVGAVGYDYADAAASGVAGLAADQQLIVKAEVSTRHVDDRLGFEVVYHDVARNH